jgi:hypothetical protein
MTDDVHIKDTKLFAKRSSNLFLDTTCVKEVYNSAVQQRAKLIDRRTDNKGKKLIRPEQ